MLSTRTADAHASIFGEFKLSLEPPESINEIDALPDGFLPRLSAGLRATVLGANLIAKHPSLLRFGIWPVLINMMITLATFALLVIVGIWIVTDMHPWFQSATGGFAQFMWTVLEIAFVIGVLAVCIGISVVGWYIFNGVLAGHFYSKLAEQVEITLGADETKFQSVTFGQDVAGAIYNLCWLLGGNMCAMALHVIPMIGGIAAFCVGTYVTVLILGIDFLGNSLNLRGMKRSDQIKYARENSTVTCGLGAVVFLGQMLPILGALLHLSATAGSVILYHQLEKTQRLAESSKSSANSDQPSVEVAGSRAAP